MDPVEPLKEQLRRELVDAIEGWLPGELANRMNIDQPRISDLRHGRLKRISLERLVRWLYAMRRDVELTVRVRR